MRKSLLFGFTLLLASASPRLFALCSQSIQLPDGLQNDGAIYRIYMPEQSCWNGNLVIYAHGYVDITQPIAIPEDQLVLPDGTSIPATFNALGYAFALSSYSQNGLAVVPGVADSLDVVSIFNQVVGKPGTVYMSGVSEGGLVATLSMEQYYSTYAAGVAACGPIGDFNRQLSYDGDFRVLWDYFFSHVIPGSPVRIPQEVITDWNSVYVPKVTAAYQASPIDLGQLLKVAQSPIQLNPPNASQTVDGVLWYSTFGTNDATEKLGGEPYDNATRVYSGSLDDAKLNAEVPRFTADPAALRAVAKGYQTSGKLVNPLVTLHTIGDEIVPYFHETLYREKARIAGSSALHTVIPVSRFGHCNFTVADVLTAFAVMLNKAGGTMPADADLLLPDAAAREEFHREIAIR